MSCLICAGDADTIESQAGWEERDCGRCGRYRFSQSLVLMLMEQGQIFDTVKMRQWLDTQRMTIESPSIEIHEALLLA